MADMLAAIEAALSRSAKQSGAAPDVDRRDRVLHLARRHVDFGIDRAEPVREILGLVGDKWSTLILEVLATGTYRYTALRELVAILSLEGSISHRILASKLRDLERCGLLVRKIWPTVPPKVEYSLAPLGQSLVAQVESLIAWAETHHVEIRQAGRDFEARQADEGNSPFSAG